MKKPKRKKENWEELIKKCKYGYICDCGNSELCDHEDNIDDYCDKEICPIWNSNKRLKG